MNEFTKEELEEICDSIRIYSRATWYRELEEKIQNMINDYCEHQGRSEQIACKAGKFIKCDTCGVFYRDNQ